MDIAILTVLNKIGELGSFASSEYSRLKDVDLQVSDLRSKLEFLMAWIQVAEEGNRIKRDQLVSVWVSQLRGAVFDAEDIIDEYIQELHRPGGENRPPVVEAKARTRRGRSFVSSCFPFRSVEEVAVRHSLSRQIREVLRRLDEIQRNSLFNMQPRVDALANTIQVFDRPTADTLKCGDPWTLVGLDGYTQSIIGLLHKDNGKREAIVIVGESGIGKTTAARAVLQSQDVQKHFDVCAWVCLPPKSRVDKYLDLILEQAQLQTHLHCRRREGVLDKMKLLVVLDGMDNIDELMDVLSELPRGTKGSRIMVTTQLQIKKIEQCIPGIRPVEIKCLKRPDCLKLLCRGLSGNPRRVYDAHKDKFDEKIYDISGGLPLAVVLLRGLVYFKDHEAQWNEVFELLKSYQHKRLIKRILTVSYTTMPTDLKLCFLYFSAMPPNIYVDLDKLQRLLSAEGILKSTSRVMGVEEEEGCLDMLVSRGLVQRVEGGTKLCIHQSVHGFAKTMAHETGFMEAHSQFDIRDTSIVRGLSVHNYVDRRVSMEKFLPKTRTLLGDFAEDYCVDEAVHPSGSHAISPKGLKNHSRLEFLCQSRFLRVLDLQGIQLGKLPDNIGRMIHLTYIGLRSCGLKDLPSSVAKLLNLETLDITGNDIQTVVDEFWNIEKLKHVLAKKLSLPVSSASMSLVTNLETLHGVALSSVGPQENSSLNKMRKLLSLAVVSVTATNVLTLALALQEINGLRHLKIAGDCSPVTFPCTRLCSLELDGKVLLDDASAQSLNSSCSFTKCRLVLRSSCMSQVLLDIFLSNLLLSELALLDDSFIGSKLFLRKGPFCDIEKLRIGNLKLLEELVIESETTLLNTIEIFGCPNMKTIQGLKNSEYLKNVVLFDMPEIVAQIKAEDKELFYKIKHVRTEAWESET
uniref:Uncharacterized protein n=1 Tax=Avena sativa TaxID=4498 RepID=A0ACD5TT35_AVESA